MQTNFEVIMNTENDGMFVLVDNQPNIVISPPDKAGWREVLIGIHQSIYAKPILKDAEEYIFNELKLSRNNSMRNWRWTWIHTDEHGMKFYTTNVRNTPKVGEEE